MITIKFTTITPKFPTTNNHYTKVVSVFPTLSTAVDKCNFLMFERLGKELGKKKSLKILYIYQHLLTTKSIVDNFYEKRDRILWITLNLT